MQETEERRNAAHGEGTTDAESSQDRDGTQRVVRIGLDRLRAHPRNSNVMDAASQRKLKAHLKRNGWYPPLIVRPSPDGEDGAYQVLDGHHRRRALQELGREAADCVVWDVDHDEALVLLGTLNRLRGQDDPKRRAALIEETQGRLRRSASELAGLLPESSKQIERHLSLRRAPPEPAKPRSLGDMPVAVHFFLTGEQKRRLDEALSAIGGRREDALMMLIERAGDAFQPEDRDPKNE
jgi:ParB/RepB/Spo0J family partition protein